MITPLILKPGNKAMIIAPSGIVPAHSMDTAVKTLQKWGMKVSLGTHVYASNSVFAGSDGERCSDFQQALDDSTISLILSARGGYGLTRILDKLSFTKFYSNPKWIVGFSDLTAFHMKAFKKEILTIHGPMGTSFEREKANNSIEELHKLLFTFKSVIKTETKQLRTGNSKGRLVGGNLSLICESLGTSTEIDTEDKILVLEDSGDYYYRIDRMLNQLERAGKFKNIKGLVIGSFSDMLNGANAFIESVEEMINRLTAEYNYPVAVSMPIGHEPQNYPFVHGAVYSLQVKDTVARLEIITKL